jgi:argininosuccinate lyase
MHSGVERKPCNPVTCNLKLIMKLWQKDKASLKQVEQFTVGNDREFDLMLAPFDILGSIAHVTMLESVGLLQKEEKDKLVKELREIYKTTDPSHASRFTIHAEVEDIHSQIELLLTQKLGDTGKKIHSARSRNDQVLVDIKLFLRNELEELVKRSSRSLNYYSHKAKNIRIIYYLVTPIYNLPCHPHLDYGLVRTLKAW